MMSELNIKKDYGQKLYTVIFYPKIIMKIVLDLNGLILVKD